MLLLCTYNDISGNVTYCYKTDTYIITNDKSVYESDMRIKGDCIIETSLREWFLYFLSPYMLLLWYVIFAYLNYIISNKYDILG